MMATVLRILSELFTQPNLAAFVARRTDRLAFARALDAHMADFSDAA
jgi:hypothetical protein